MLRSLLLAAALPGVVAAQDLARQVTGHEGTIRFSYTTKPTVCGQRRGGISMSHGHYVRHVRRVNDYDCLYGPAEVSFTVREGRVIDADLRVGYPAPGEPGTDLGRVAAPRAAEALLRLARTAPSGVGDDLVIGAVVADSAVIWPGLLDLAKNSDVPKNTRKSTMLWLGAAAGDALVGPKPEGEEEEEDVADAAVFALSQRPHSEGIPALIRVIHGSGPAHAKRSALFWLGQSGDPRALDEFEKILKH
jgi:hypothetical protein